MAQVSNVQSRTLRVLGSLPQSVKDTLLKQDGVSVLEKESKGNVSKSKTFITGEEIDDVISVLSSNNLSFRPHFYSIFAKFNTELKSTEVDKLNVKIMSVVPDAEVSYSRIDNNGHTGKVVVDRFEDYNTLRAYTAGDFTFYKFNRTKAQTRGTMEGDVRNVAPRDTRQAPRDTRQVPRDTRQSTSSPTPMLAQRSSSGPVDNEGFQTVGRSQTRSATTRGRGRPRTNGTASNNV
jgi:hypothetical protein